jgi:hypothetical protein
MDPDTAAASTKFDVGEKEVKLGRRPGGLAPHDLFIGVGDIVIGDCDRSDLRRSRLEGSRVRLPR